MKTTETSATSPYFRVSSSGRVPTSRTSQTFNEEDIIKGLTVQQSWQEKPELSFLSASLLKLCAKSPNDSDAEWNETLEELRNAVNTFQFKITRQMIMFKSRDEDANFLSSQQQKEEEDIIRTSMDIESAKEDLTHAKEGRNNREKYEKLSKRTAKRVSIPEIRNAKLVELKLKKRSETLANRIQKRIECHQKQAAVVLQVASDFRNALSEPLASEDDIIEEE